LLAAALLHQLAGEASEALSYATHSHQIAREHGNRSYEGRSLLHMGNTLAALERWQEANAAYTDALLLYQELDIQPAAAEAQAGLARAALAQGDRTLALTWVERILTILDEKHTAGLDEPFLIYLTCYRVLAANDDERATSLLQRGHDLLQAYAAQIQDHTLRNSFLEHVVVHRELKVLYERGRSAGVPA
jgi:tetratricopeptide (TPR) repeat protein